VTSVRRFLDPIARCVLGIMPLLPSGSMGHAPFVKSLIFGCFLAGAGNIKDMAGRIFNIDRYGGNITLLAFGGNTITHHHQSPITNHQSPITNHQSPITNHQPPTTNHQPPTTNHTASANYQASDDCLPKPL
jgi:hypothetical protein